MTPDTMRRALQQVRSGRLADATTLIQTTLTRHGLIGADPGATNEGRVDPVMLSPPPMRHEPVLPRAPRRAPLFPTGDFAVGGHSNGRERFSSAAGSREFVLHLPKNCASPPRGLVLMLHGCTQTPEDFATGTGLNAVAEAAGLITVWPAQSRGNNAQSCWNWFSGADQHEGRGEPAILAELVRDVAARHHVPDDALFVAGLSAGAAMAVILGQTYPQIFAAVGAHSGLPYGCARGMGEAFAAMSDHSGVRRARTPGKPVRTIVFHGAADATVAPANGLRIFDDALSASGKKAGIVEDGSASGRQYRRTTTRGPQGRVFAEHWQIDGLGHAWSGGNPQGSYADAKGPDASAEIIRFFLSRNEDGA